MRHLALLPLSLAAVALAVGCAGSSGSKFSPVDGATAQSAGSSLGDSAEGSAGSLGGANGPTFAPGTQGVCDTGTVTRNPLQPVDSDGDHSPDTVTITFTNCMVSGTNGSETVNGTVSVVDGTPTTADYNFTASHDLTVAIVGANAHAGTSANLVLTGVRSAAGASSGSTFTMNDATSNDATYTTASASHHVTDSKTWDVVYTPSTAWTPGLPPVAGGLAISGGWSVHVDDKGADSTLASSGLQVDPACSTHIVAGTLTATYAATSGQSALITVTWSGCGSRTVTYTGP